MMSTVGRLAGVALADFRVTFPLICGILVGLSGACSRKPARTRQAAAAAPARGVSEPSHRPAEVEQPLRIAPIAVASVAGVAPSPEGRRSLAAICKVERYGGHEYFFCDKLVDRATARAQCVSAGLQLVHIDNAAENEFVARIMERGCCPQSLSARARWPGLWIGATDEQQEGAWVWDDDGTQFWQGGARGVRVNELFSSWAEGQPNDGNLGPTENCMRSNRGKWSDTPCAINLKRDLIGLGYVCEGLPPE